MEILNEFGINPLLLAAQVVNFLLLLFILKKFLYGPILKVLQERKETVAQSLKNAEEIENKLIKISQEEQERLKQASLEGEKLIKQAQDEGVHIIEEARIKAENLSAKVLEDAHAQLILEREKLQKEVKAHLGDLVITALQKVLGKTVTKEEDKKLIQKTIQEIEA